MVHEFLFHAHHHHHHPPSFEEDVGALDDYKAELDNQPMFPPFIDGLPLSQFARFARQPLTGLTFPNNTRGVFFFFWGGGDPDNAAYITFHMFPFCTSTIHFITWGGGGHIWCCWAHRDVFFFFFWILKVFVGRINLKYDSGMVRKTWLGCDGQNNMNASVMVFSKDGWLELVIFEMKQTL